MRHEKIEAYLAYQIERNNETVRLFISSAIDEFKAKVAKWGPSLDSLETWNEARNAAIAEEMNKRIEGMLACIDECKSVKELDFQIQERRERLIGSVMRAAKEGKMGIEAIFDAHDLEIVSASQRRLRSRK